ncbi:MAG TPA: penicillin acylase family protein, partial [Actinomycetota bacterium]|nr:penicillin acylase family protein [Actinomycetota bacterium]
MAGGIAVAHAASPGLSQNPGLFLNILPAGQGTTTTTKDATVFEATKHRPHHDMDQRGMYARLPLATTITGSDLKQFFKPESFGPSTAVERTEKPVPGLTIERDGFGVPHIYGKTRGKAEFGAGYVAGEDRLFMIDVLRHVARAQLSSFAGG